ncbi:MAG: 2Fe-2S iron-sulfur cluster-binding protein [Bdellovibrionales bacterium]
MKICFEGIGTFNCEENQSVLELTLKNKIPLNHSCGGNATCGTCRVIVKSEIKELPPRNEVEQEMAEDRDFELRERLGCQLACYDGLIVEIPQEEVE